MRGATHGNGEVRDRHQTLPAINGILHRSPLLGTPSRFTVGTMRVGTVSVAVLTAALALTTIGHASTPSNVKAHAITPVPLATYLTNSTQAVCSLTGEHGKY